MDNPQPKPAALSFVVGGLSFIPGIGILFGLTAIIIGLSTSRQGGRKLALLGASGIAFSVVLYGSLFYFGFAQRGGIFDGLRKQLAESTINSLVPEIELYKLQHGHYPDSLETLQESMPKNSMELIVDPSVSPIGAPPRNFYYQLAGTDHYYLLGLGPDGLPFTADDILPEIKITPGSQIGLLVKPKA